MRQFAPTYEYKFKIQKILHETDKAILFLMKKDNVSIWVPKAWIKKRGKTFFAVSNRMATEVNLKIYAEL
jgi:hypothetical protein|tara:strand:- start:2142 stop:2351 length:210 start_codon:yes stop_codon:yes gene_type:complete